MTEDENARKARAAALGFVSRAICFLSAAPEEAKPESPREFVDRRMRELDRKGERKPRKN